MGLAPPVCAISVMAITNWSHSLHVFVPLPYIQQVKTFEQRHTIKWSQWMPIKQIRVLNFTNNLKNQRGREETKSGLGHPKWLLHSFLPTQNSHSGPEWSMRNLREVLWGSPQTRTYKSSIFYILRKMNSPFGILQGSMPYIDFVLIHCKSSLRVIW